MTLEKVKEALESYAKQEVGTLEHLRGNPSFRERPHNTIACKALIELNAYIARLESEDLEAAFSSLYYKADKLCRRAEDKNELPRCITDLTCDLDAYKTLNDKINQCSTNTSNYSAYSKD